MKGLSQPFSKETKTTLFFPAPSLILEMIISYPRVTCRYSPHPPAKARPQSSRPGEARLSSSGERPTLQQRSRDGFLLPPLSLPSSSSWLLYSKTQHTDKHLLLRVPCYALQSVPFGKLIWKWLFLKQGSCQQRNCYSILNKTTNTSG